MEIEILREQLKSHYKKYASADNACNVESLSDGEILKLANDHELVKTVDDDTIDSIPAPIFFELFT